MTHLDDVNLSGRIVNCVDHSVGTNSDTVQAKLAGEFLAADPSDDALAVLLLANSLELPASARLDENAIACHACGAP